MNIGGVEIGRGHPCRFVAEMSNGFNGDAARLRRMILAAKQSGADLVKLQAYLPSELIALRGDGPAPEPWGSQGYTMASLYERARTPLEWFEWIPAYCALVGIPWFASVFGPDSLAAVEGARCPAYKIARLDNQHANLVSAVVQTGKPYLVSTDGARVDYVDAHGRDRGVRGDNLLYCAPNYPTPPEDMELPVFLEPDGYVYFLGLSSHCLDPRLPIAAVARGASLLEYHFMLDGEPSALEANVSLGESAFRRMVADVRATEALLG